MENREKLRFAVIGAGVISKSHIAAIQGDSEAELVAIADSVAGKAEEKAAQHGIPQAYRDYEDMLRRDDIDAVSICLPSGMHADAVIACAQAGKHVLCEKPLDITAEKMERMIGECRRRGVKLGVVYQRRTLPSVVRAREAIRQGQLGKLVLGDVYMKYYRSADYYRSAGWRGTWALDGGGALMNQGVHGVDLIQWLMGDVASVFAYSAALAREIEVEDTAVAAVRYKNGAFGIIQGATTVYPELETRFEIHGEKGSVTIGDGGVKSWKQLPDDPGAGAEPFAFDGSDSMQSGHAVLVRDLIEAIRDDREPMITGEEARKAVDLILAIYESARTGREVRL
ncbi:Gfo/Idh/MocA family protein [Paenibacillus cymbidii]|uniref:Gfo/Idh/MocA family protein n=1 Tax=Paenibacillus cymbidii TaxID=1639034 RepID=UPI001F3C0C61|nr:Gfo/Idh/MocA family oxidoreductase [Paenibacillus cymbidii]